MKWLNKIILKLASEVHKSRIDELEKRILEIEKKHEVILKSISDNENTIEKLEEKLYKSDLKVAKFEGAITVLIEKAKSKQSIMIKGGQGNE